MIFFLILATLELYSSWKWQLETFSIETKWKSNDFAERMIFTMQQIYNRNICTIERKCTRTKRRQKKNEQLHSFAKILLATRHFVLWPIFFSLLFRIVMHFWVTKFIIWTHCRIFVYEKKLRSNLNTIGKKWRVLSSDWNVSCFYRYIKNNIFLLLQTWYLIHLVFVYLVAFYRSHFWPDVFSSKNSPTNII